MKNKKKAKSPAIEKLASHVTYSLFPRPICLEKCTMNIKKGYEADILKTLRAFSNKETFEQKNAHKLTDYKVWGNEAWSIDVKSRDNKYRMFFYIDNHICKITDLCSEDTH